MFYWQASEYDDQDDYKGSMIYKVYQIMTGNQPMKNYDSAIYDFADVQEKVNVLIEMYLDLCPNNSVAAFNSSA